MPTPPSRGISFNKILPTLVLDVAQLEHDLVGLFVPNVLGHRRSEALFPAPCLPLARHSPSIVPVRIHLIEDFKAGCLFLSPHAREAGLRHRALDDLFPVVETSPLGNLYLHVTTIGRSIFEKNKEANVVGPAVSYICQRVGLLELLCYKISTSSAYADFFLKSLTCRCFCTIV